MSSINPIALAALIARFASLKSARFAGFTYRAKETGELARHVLILGASYAALVSDSLKAIAAAAGTDFASDVASTKAHDAAVAAAAVGSPARKAANAARNAFQAVIGAERAAAAELYLSLAESELAMATGTEHSAYTKAGQYASIVPGIRVNLNDGTLELAGLSHSKTVLEAGTYKDVNSSAKTLAKAALRRSLPIGRFRTFALDAGALESARMEGEELVFG